MRAFDFKTEYNKLLTPEIVAYLTQIHEYKGQQNLFIEAKADALSELLEVAKIQSTEASNRIEGIITTDDRLKKIVRDKTMPKTRSEKEIAGYRDVLATIHESHDFIPPKPSIICSFTATYLNSAEKLSEETTKTPTMSLQKNWRMVSRLPAFNRSLRGKRRRLLRHCAACLKRLCGMLNSTRYC